MMKNKKKLRRAERKYSVSRTAQSLVLTGLLLAGGAGSALAATEINAATTWDASAATGDITYTGATDKEPAVTTSGANTAGTLGTLTITGTSNLGAALTAAHDLKFTGAVSITGATGKLGSLAIDADKTFTSGTKTTVGDYGKLTIAGTHVGLLEATGANSSAIEVTGTQKGDVTLNGTGASLEGIADTAQVWGNVTVTKGTLKSGTTTGLTIKGADGTGLGNVILGADSTLTLNTTKALTLGTLTVNKDTAVAGMLSFAALDGDKKLTLNSGGDITVQDANNISLNVTLNKAGTSGLVLGDGGSLTAADLTLKGFSNAVTTATGALTLTANKLIMDEATTFGAGDTNKATTVTIRTKTGQTDTDFINQDITIKGYSGQAGTLNLGDDDNTGSATTTKNITLAGKALSADAVMNVGYGTFGVGTINVGSATDVAAGGSGTITVANGGTLNATTVNLFGLSAEKAKLDLAATVGNANIGTLNVGGAATYGAVTVAGSAAGSAVTPSTLSVGTLNIGTNGLVDIKAHGVLNIKGSYNIAHDKLAASGITGGGINVATDGTLHVQDTLTITNGSSDITAAVGGTVMTDVIKVNTGTNKLTWNGGNLTLLGNAAGKFLEAGELLVNNSAIVNLGVTGNSPVTSGGTFAGTVTANAGTLMVNNKEWTINKVVVASADAVQVRGGILNVANWDSKTTAAGTATVQGGTLNLTGTTVGSVITTGDKNTDTTDITASAGGVVTANASAVLDADLTELATDVGKFGVTDTGVLKIKTSAKDMTIGEYTDLKRNILTTNSTGTLRLDGVTITGVDENTSITQVDGVSVAGNVVAVADNNKVTSFGTEVKGLKGLGAADVTLTVSGGLTIVGGSNADFKLSDNGDFKTNITVSGASNQLNLGSAASNYSYGTLKGNVTLSDNAANLNATKGTFVVGDVVAGANGNGAVKADGANLTTGALGTSSNRIGSVTASNGIVQTASDAFVNNVTLNNGGMQAKDMTVTTANVGNGTLLATNDMALTTANLKGGTAQANKDMTVGTANVDGGKLIAGNDLTVTTFNNGAASAVNDAVISAGNKLTITGAMDASKVTILAKELDAAAAITAANSTINVGKMVLKNTVALTEGTSMNVGEFTGAGTAQTVTVGATADKTGSSLTIGKLTSGSAVTTFFVDPTADNSIVQVKSVDAAGVADKLIAANNGIVSFGQHGMDWAKKQMAESGMAPTAALILSNPVKLAATGQLLVGKDFDNTGQWTGDASPSTHALDVRGNSLIIADVSGLGSNAALDISAATTKIARIDSTAGIRLYSDSLKGDQSYTLVSGLANVAGTGLIQDGNTVANGGSLKLASKSTSNMLVGLGDVVYSEGTGTNGTLKANTIVNNAADVLPRISTSMGSYLENMARTTGFDTASDNTGVRFVSRALDNRYVGTNNPTQAAATIEGAAQLAVVGAVPAMTLSAAQAATSAATTRTSFSTPLMDSTKAVALHQGTDGSLSLDSGLSAGSSMKTGLGVWIMPLYQSNNVWGMKAENFKGGYNSDLGGVALGADYTIDDSLRFGLAFNLGGGYAKSSGDFNSTDNSFNFWGINLYGGWTKNNFGLSGDVGYTSTYNKVKQELPSAMEMADIKSDVTSRAWTAGLRGEYKFATEVVDIIPHVGVRYLGLTTDDYKAKSGGGTVFKADEAFQSIWTFPVGLTFSKEMTTSSGWSFRPQLDLGVTPAAGDVKAKSRVRIPNVDSSAEMKMQVMDYLSYDGGVGLEMKKDNVSFGVNYNIQASEHRTGHGVFGTFRYEF